MAAPTQEIAPVITCVVLTGTQKCDAVKRLIALAVLEAKPSIGVSFTIFDPIVFIILHPPVKVPIEIAVYAPIITHIGIAAHVSRRFTERRRLMTIPIVFCASFAPCQIE